MVQRVESVEGEVFRLDHIVLQIRQFHQKFSPRCSRVFFFCFYFSRLLPSRWIDLNRRGTDKQAFPFSQMRKFSRPLSPELFHSDRSAF